MDISHKGFIIQMLPVPRRIKTRVSNRYAEYTHISPHIARIHSHQHMGPDQTQKLREAQRRHDSTMC